VSDDVKAVIQQARAALDAYETAANNKAEADRQAAEIRKKQQLNDTVAKFGTPSQQARWKENLLVVTEVENLIEYEAFKPLANFKLYEKLTKSDLDSHDSKCSEDPDNPNVTFAVFEENVKLSESAFETYSAIKKALTDAKAQFTLTLRTHRMDCADDDCYAFVWRDGVRVRITVGEFNFAREYGL
jgi:hypothetical protein